MKKLLIEHGNTKEGIISIIQLMADKGYERKEREKEEREEKRDFESTSWETPSEYRENALVQLQNDFPFLKVDSLRTILTRYKFHYTPSLKALEKALGRKGHCYITRPAPCPLREPEIHALLPGLVSMQLESNDLLALASRSGHGSDGEGGGRIPPKLRSVKKSVMRRELPLPRRCKIFEEELEEWKKRRENERIER